MKLNKKEFYTKSNLLSLFRLLLGIPIFLLIGEINSSTTLRFITMGVLIFAAATDILDGYLARKYNEITELGKIIDPLADKFVIGLIIIKLYLIGDIPTYYIMVVLGRDILILIGGVIVTKKIGMVMPSNILGKITALSIGLFILGVVGGFKTSLPDLYNILLSISILLALTSFIAYLVRAKEAVTRKNNESI